METVEGRRAVYELLKSSQQVAKIYIAKNLKPSDIVEKIEALATKQGVHIDRVDKLKLDEMSKTGVHQGIIALAEPFKYLTFAELAKSLNTDKKPALLLLDGITDPQNFGALLRTADAAGISGVIVTKKRASPITPAVHKASAGATAYVKIAQVSNLTYTINDLKKMGFWIVGASEKAGKLYFEADFNLPVAIVLGGEGKGVSRLVKEKCDYLVSIPMKGKISSLNVSVAGGILMYEVLRQRLCQSY